MNFQAKTLFWDILMPHQVSGLQMQSYVMQQVYNSRALYTNHLELWDSPDSAWRRGGSGETFSMSMNTWKETAAKMEPHSSQGCPVARQEATGTNWDTGGTVWTTWITSVLHRCQISWSHLAVALGILLWVSLLWEGWAIGTQRSLPTCQSLILEFCDISPQNSLQVSCD